MMSVAPEQVTENIREYRVCHTFNRNFINCLNKLHRQYGDDVFEVLGIANRNLDIARFSEDFFSKSVGNVADVSVDDNANVSDKNISHYESESTKALQKLNSLAIMYEWVEKIFTKKDADSALEKILNGEIFVNDLYGWNKSYCFSFDLRNILYEGMSFFKGNMTIKPPKRSSSFMALIIQTVAYVSNQIMGAFSAPDLFVCLNWFYEKEFGKEYLEEKNPATLNEIKNQFQNFIYSMNFPFRGAGQSAFTNFSVLDKGFLTALFTKEGVSKQDYIYPDGTSINAPNIIKLSQLFFEYYSEINSTEGLFTFPVMTLAISRKEDGAFSDPDFVEWVCKANSEKGLGNIYIGKPDSFSSCCRMRSDFTKMGSLGYQNSFGVASLGIGSHRVCGLNLPRLAYLEEKNPEALEETLEIIHKVLVSHRTLIASNVESGTMPLYSSGWISLKRQYSTVGFVGMYEYLKNKGLSLLEDKTIEKGVSLLKKIEAAILEWQEKEENPYNMEQIPAESMAVRLCKLDTLLGFNPHQYPLYSNQYLPLWEEVSIYDRFRLQGIFDSLTSGGAILHINVQDSKPLSPIQFRALLEQARVSGTTYFAINLAFSECPKHHYSIGQREECPVCHGPIVNQYTRVVGYLSKVSAWNKVRRTQDYPNRYFYKNGKLAALADEGSLLEEKQGVA